MGERDGMSQGSGAERQCGLPIEEGCGAECEEGDEVEGLLCKG